jgi:hypothetical protein
MFSRIGFTALLRGSGHCRRSHEYLRAAPSLLATTPPSPCPPGLGPPSPVPPSPAPTHQITEPPRPRRALCWPFLTHTLKRYLVAKFNPQGCTTARNR